MQKRIRNLMVMAATLCVALSTTVVATLFVQISATTTTLYVDPPIIEDPTILPNDTIAIRIAVDVVANMKICEFNLTFSPAILSIQSITKLKVQDQYPQSTIDAGDEEGYIWVNLSYRIAVTITTNTSLLEIVFNVKDYGSTSLHFETSTLKDGSGTEIPHETRDGFVHIFMRNIAVQSIALPYTETYSGRVIPINVTVLNDGEITENFTVSLYYDTTLIGTQDVVNLTSKESITKTFNWDTSGVSPRAEPYTIKAEASILPNEANTEDNVLVDGTIMLKIVGDINGDRKVDINDLIAWDSAYGSHLGDSNWNEQADINYDGTVDKADATLILDHYKEPS